MHGKRDLWKILALALICMGCDLKFHDTTKTVFDVFPVLLNNDGRAKTDPAWSPDGNFIAYGVEGRLSKFLAFAWANSQTSELGEFEAIVKHGYFDYHLGRNEVVYVEENGGQLFVLNFGTGEKRQLTFFPTTLSDPAWSQDGEWVAFTARDPRSRYLTIWAVSSVGETVPIEVVSLDGHAIRPSWSPGGDKLVFQLVKTRDQIGIADFPSGEIEFLSPDSVDSDAPDWSPDGSQIAFFSRRNAVWTMRSDGSDPKQLTGRTNGLGRIAWSPDGSKIAYEDLTYFGWRAISIISDEGDFLAEQLSDAWPVWHSDADLFAITTTPFSLLEVFSLLDSSTTQVTQPKPQRVDRQPAWFPDNNTLVFTDASTDELWTTSVTEANVQPFVSDANSVRTGRNPAVSPDGKWLVADWGPLFLYPLDSRQAVNLGERLGYGLRDPAWNPTSTGIIVRQGVPEGLRIITTDSNLVIDEHFIPGAFSQPAWARGKPGFNLPIAARGPDGIHIMSPDGKNRELAIYDGHSPTWAPDGLRLAYIYRSRLYVAQIFVPLGGGND